MPIKIGYLMKQECVQKERAKDLYHEIITIDLWFGILFVIVFSLN